MALSPHSIRRFSGLFGSTNPFGRVPEGACSILDNCVIRSSDVLEPRPGFKASASCGAPVNALTFKQGVAVGITYDNQGAGITGALRKYDPAADAWTTLPMNPGGFTIDRPGSFQGVGTRFVSSQKALYFQSKYGLTKIEDIATGVCRAAVQPPVLGTNDFTLTDAFGAVSDGNADSILVSNFWLANGNGVCYRITVARFGANGELIESEPSARFAVKNALGSAAGVIVQPAPPYLCAPGTFYRVWRSKTQVASASDPTDEMFLVSEVAINTALGSNGYFQIGQVSVCKDNSSESSLTVPLYTNQQTGETAAAANTSAPLSADMVWFRGRMYYLNTTDFQRLTVRIIGTNTGGILDGDSFTLNGQKFLFRNSTAQGNVNPGTIILYMAGTVVSNIDKTANETALNVNDYYSGLSPGNAGFIDTGPLEGKVIAIYDAVSPNSASSSDVGTLRFQSVVPGRAPITFKTNSSLGWDKDYTAGTASSNNAQAAGLMWSALDQPEGVPLANNTVVGDPVASGQRLIALKESLFVFKQDGLWKVTDDGSSLGPLIQPIDPTIRLVAPETAVALDNFILALCDQGVVLISETGAVVNITHQQIERELLALMARVGSSTLASLAFGVAYQPEHTYILSLPESSNATACTRQYVYNLQTQAWDSWTVPGVLCGAVHPDTGQLYFGKTDGTIWIERKNQDSSDYQDPGFTVAFPAAMPTHTNLLFQSQSIGTAPWTTQNTGTASPVVVTQNFMAAPDGTVTATRLQFNRGAGNALADIARVFQSVSGLSVGQVHDYSLWIKSTDGSTQNVAIEEHSGSFRVVQATAQWQRFPTTATPSVASENSCYIGTRGTYGSDAVVDVCVWGAQLEVASTPGDYIQTLGAAQTMGNATASLVFAGDLRTGTTPFAVGDLVQQPNSGVAAKFLQQRVTAVSYNSGTDRTTVTLDAAPDTPWDDTSFVVVKAVQCNITFLPIFADEPLQDKEWGDSFLSFRYCDLDFLLAGFTSEKYPIPTGTNPAIERINNSDGSAAPVTLQTWAPSPWGQTIWGRQTKDVILKATIPQDVQGYSAQLTLSLTMPCALSRFELSALDVKITGETYQVTR